jgi:hypothetical protein
VKTPLSDDPEVQRLFELVCSRLASLFGYSEVDAWSLLTQYHRRFTDKSYCDSIGVDVQDDDFFFHEAPMGMALRVQYFVGLKDLPGKADFLEWRKDVVKRLKEQ